MSARRGKGGAVGTGEGRERRGSRDKGRESRMGRGGRVGRMVWGR